MSGGVIVSRSAMNPRVLSKILASSAYFAASLCENTVMRLADSATLACKISARASHDGANTRHFGASHSSPAGPTRMSGMGGPTRRAAQIRHAHGDGGTRRDDDRGR